MTTLITGVGLIGTSFAKFAMERGERLVFVDAEPRSDYLAQKLGDGDVAVLRRDIRDLPALIQAMTGHQVDTVIHTAGLIGGRVADPLYTGVQVNVLGTVNVAEAVRLAGVTRLVHVSTFGVYDRSKEGEVPITEDFPLGGAHPYTATKVANELLLQAYAGQYGFELIVVRPANVFGVGHFWAGSGGGATVQALVEAGIQGEIARMPATRDFEYVYAKDVGRAVDLAATVPQPAQTKFNVGNGTITSFAELVEAVKAVLPELSVEVLPGDSPIPNLKQPMDLSASKQHLGWEPRFSLEAAFQDYADELRVFLARTRP